MSYHNCSVWPHDNALIALGLARYGHVGEAVTIFGALFDASTHMDLRRLPAMEQNDMDRLRKYVRAWRRLSQTG